MRRVWRWAWPPVAVAGAVALLVLAGWQAARWDDVGDSTCGPLYRPSIWSASQACRARTLPRLGLAVAAVLAAGALLTLAVRALAAESLNRAGRPSP